MSMDFSEVLLYYDILKDGSVFSKRAGKVLSPVLKKTGYLHVTLSIQGRTKTWMLHRLIALAFVPEVEGLGCVNHKDGNRTNNDPSNLEWCTHKQNNQCRILNKLTMEDSGEIRTLYSTGEYTQKELANIYNVNQSHISRVIAQKQWL